MHLPLGELVEAWPTLRGTFLGEDERDGLVAGAMRDELR
jgi:hypothetical protein